MNKDLISRSALKKQLRKKQLKKKIFLKQDAEFERGYHFAINTCINLLNIFPTVDISDTKYLEERDADAYETGYLQGYIDGSAGADMRGEANV